MRILYVTTIKATMGFFNDEFSHLIKKGHIIELACNCNDTYESETKKIEMVVHNISFSRSPFSTDNIKAYAQLKKLVKENHYDIVHCHTPNAAAITRLACMGIKGTKVIYTAHGFHFYKGAPKKNWLVYYPIEWLCAHWTDSLITINLEDYMLAKRHMKARNIEYVPGVGINLDKFADISTDIFEKRDSLGIPCDATILLSVGELNANKNHETVIRAIEGMDVYYLIAGKGDNEQRLLKIAQEVGMEDRVQLLGFRRDVLELLQVADAYVFPSYREGLSVSLMETMASGKPAIVSEIRGNVDLIDSNGGALFDPYSVAECREAIRKVLKSDSRKMGQHNKEKIKQFSTEVVLKRIDDIYEKNI